MSSLLSPPGFPWIHRSHNASVIVLNIRELFKYRIKLSLLYSLATQEKSAVRINNTGARLPQIVCFIEPEPALFVLHAYLDKLNTYYSSTALRILISSIIDTHVE